MDNVQIESRIDVLEEELGALKREVELLREEIRALARRESED